MSDFDAILQAIEADDIRIAATILERNKEVVSQTDASGATLLHHAAIKGRRQIAQLLIGHGANINQRDAEFGATPAGWAIEYLRELGGQLAIELEDLAYAIQTRDAKWARRFLNRFPHLRTAVYRDGITFRQLAAESSDSRIIELFGEVQA